jgi:hypothetical protein
VTAIEKKLGRPTDNPRTEKIGVRLSEREMSMLNECAERLGTTRANVIAMGVEKVYQELERN